MMEWDRYFLKMCDLVASKSKDRSTKVGAVIVGPDREIRSTGYNGFPRGVNDNIEERHLRPDKYLWTEHAERNAILNAARVGIPLKGCTMYKNWGDAPCADCSRAIVQAGIIEVVASSRPFPGHKAQWGKSFDVGQTILDEAGLRFRVWEPLLPRSRRVLPRWIRRHYRARRINRIRAKRAANPFWSI